MSERTMKADENVVLTTTTETSTDSQVQVAAVIGDGSSVTIDAASKPATVIQADQATDLGSEKKASESTRNDDVEPESTIDTEKAAPTTAAVPLYRPPHLSRQQNTIYSQATSGVGGSFMNYNSHMGPGSKFYNNKYTHPNMPPVLPFPHHQAYPYYNNMAYHGGGGGGKQLIMTSPRMINSYRPPEFMPRRFNSTNNQRGEHESDVGRHHQASEDAKETRGCERDKQESVNEPTSGSDKSSAGAVATESESKESSSVAKTSMCLIHELVKFNKIKHEYSLLDEIGPAHKKVFYVQLKLGVDTDQVETYVSHNTSIKRAQQSVADIAYKETKFRKPTNDKTDSGGEFTKRNNLRSDEKKRGDKKQQNTLPPTVTLNALAMKLNLKPVYASKDQRSYRDNRFSADYQQLPPPFHSSDLPQFRPSYFGNKYYMPYQHQRFYVKLAFAGEEFDGDGITLQAARHSAAEQALRHFSQTENYNKAKMMSIKVKEETKSEKSVELSQVATAKTPRDESGSSLDKKGSKKQQQLSSSPSSDPSAATTSIDHIHKTSISEINLLHDYCNILDKKVFYELVQESGPSHARKFVTKCLVNSKEEGGGEAGPVKQQHETVGEGNSKKLSKLNAAIAMVKIIKENYEPLLVIHQTTSKKIKPKINPVAKGQESSSPSSSMTTTTTSATTSDSSKKRHKASKIEKANKTMPEYGKGTINPVSRLIQIQQAKKNPEPEFELVSSTSNQKPVYNKPAAAGSTVNQYANRRHEFVFQCVIKTPKEAAAAAANNTTPVEFEITRTEGKASTKKLAKQNAADAMLIRLGYQSGGAAAAAHLKPAIKNTPPPSSLDDTETNEKNVSESPSRTEKHVKFDESVVKHEIKEKTIKILKREPQAKSSLSSSPKTNQAAIDNSVEHQRIHQFKAQLYDMNAKRENSADQVFSSQERMNAYKIAAELIDSMEEKRNDNENKSEAVNQDGASEEIPSSKEFSSPTAEKLLKEKSGSSQVESDEYDETSSSLQMLVGSTKSYKKALDYLARVIGFNVNYQSVLWGDNTVKSFVSTSIETEPDKPLSGQGSTHTESSNAAALCTLKYLASKHK